MHHPFDSFLLKKLENRKREGLYRSLIQADGKIDFASNDYLGFANCMELQLQYEAHEKSGATGSRLISGNSIEAEQAEKTIAQFHKADAALIFNSGYAANVGLCSCIASKDDTFISDELIHASVIDGIRMSLAAKLKFKHNCVDDLEKKLLAASGNKFVMVESLYSMDGDEAPLEQVVEVCERHGANLIVDEAHAIGVFGERGEGFVNKYHLQDKIFACVYTFGKALGLHGAAVVGSETLKNYLINFARPFIYSTALPPMAYRQIKKAYEMLATAKRNKLTTLISYFQNASGSVNSFSFLKSNSQIQGVVVGDNAKARALSSYLFERGIYAKAIVSPTVAPKSERLRICLHTFNTEQQIDFLFEEINRFSK